MPWREAISWTAARLSALPAIASALPRSSRPALQDRTGPIGLSPIGVSRQSDHDLPAVRVSCENVQLPLLRRDAPVANVSSTNCRYEHRPFATLENTAKGVATTFSKTVDL